MCHNIEATHKRTVSLCYKSGCALIKPQTKCHRVPKFSPYGSVCCACAQRPGLPRQSVSRTLRPENTKYFFNGSKTKALGDISTRTTRPEQTYSVYTQHDFTTKHASPGLRAICEKFKQRHTKHVHVRLGGVLLLCVICCDHRFWKHANRDVDDSLRMGEIQAQNSVSFKPQRAGVNRSWPRSNRTCVADIHGNGPKPSYDAEVNKQRDREAGGVRGR